MPPATPSPDEPTARVRVIEAISSINPGTWNALVPPDGRPFLTWHFLHALEASGSAAPSRGWTPRHLTVWRGDELLAAAPGWVKTHSMGEFLYNDFRWAGVTPRFGVAYYPKLILSVPFSPATG